MHRRAFVSLLGTTGLASLAAASLPGRVLAGACAPATFSASYVQGADRPIRRGGAILVGLTMGFGGGVTPGPDPLAGTYTLHRGETSIPLRVERTAPGLLRLIPTRFVAGDFKVRGPAGEKDVTLEDTPAAVVPPVFLRSVAVSRYAGSQQPYSPPGWSVSATFRDALPAGAVGVLACAEAAAAPYTLFAVATPGGRGVSLYSSPGRCQASVPGVEPPSVGSVIRLAVIDKGGALSVRSNHVRVED